MGGRWWIARLGRDRVVGMEESAVSVSVSYPTVLLDLFVPGVPRPKGSLTPQKVKAGDGRETGRIRLVDSDLSKLWRRTVAVAVRRECLARGIRQSYAGPVGVTALFGFARCCADHIHDEPHVGDLDKLLRNVYDALQDAGVYANDRQVTRDGGSSKAITDSRAHGVYLSVWAWSV